MCAFVGGEICVLETLASAPDPAGDSTYRLPFISKMSGTCVLAAGWWLINDASPVIGWAFLGGLDWQVMPPRVRTLFRQTVTFLATPATPSGRAVGSSCSTRLDQRLNSCGVKPSKFIGKQ